MSAAPQVDPIATAQGLKAWQKSQEDGVKQALAQGALAEEAKTKAAEVDAVVKAMKDENDKLTDRLNKIEAAGQRPTFHRMDGKKEKGFVDHIMDHPEFGQVRASCIGSLTFTKGVKAADGKEVETFVLSDVLFDPQRLHGQKDLSHALSTLSASAGGILMPSRRVSDVILGGAPTEVALRDFVTRQKMPQGEKFTWPREAGLFQMWTMLTAAASSGQPAIVVENPSGFHKGQKITLDPNGDAPEQAVVLSVNEKTRTITLSANLTGAYDEETEVSSSTYGFHTQTNLKPTGKMTFEEVEMQVKTLATSFSITRHMLRNLNGFADYITRRATEEMIKVENRQILYGDGTDAKQIPGFANDEKLIRKAWSELPSAAGNMVQAVDYMRAFLGNAGYSGSRVLVNDMDLFLMQNAVDSIGRPLYPDGRLPFQPIAHPAVKSGKAYIGRMDNVIFGESQSVRVEFFTQHADYAARNMVFMLVEQSVGQVVSIPESISELTFDEAPESA